MQLTHTPNQNLITSKWTGGTTTQLFIYPENATYAERNFLCRISTATVEVPESDFTHLPGVNRILMILEGELEIIHQNRYGKHLKPFETDEFSGDWETKGKGEVIDFNVMTKGNTRATLQHIELKDNINEKIELLDSIMIIYLYKGEALIDNTFVNSGDVLIIKPGQEKKTIDLQSKTQATLIIATISM